MSLPSEWVDRLFKRLIVRYGAAFMRPYELAGAAPEEVRADWAEVLGGLDGGALAYGLSVLDPDKPPNSAQFRALCKQRPAPVMPALPAPNPAGLKRLAKELAPLKNVGGVTPADLLARHRARIEQGERVSMAQRAWVQAAERRIQG